MLRDLKVKDDERGQLAIRRCVIICGVRSHLIPLSRFQLAVHFLLLKDHIPVLSVDYWTHLKTFVRCCCCEWHNTHNADIQPRPDSLTWPWQKITSSDWLTQLLQIEEISCTLCNLRRAFPRWERGGAAAVVFPVSHRLRNGWLIFPRDLNPPCRCPCQSRVTWLLVADSRLR